METGIRREALGGINGVGNPPPADARAWPGVLGPTSPRDGADSLPAAMDQMRATLEAQARVMSVLGPGVSLREVATVFAAEARRLFDDSHALVAVGGADGALELAALCSDELTEAGLVAMARARNLTWPLGAPAGFATLEPSTVFGGALVHVSSDLQSPEAPHGPAFRALRDLGMRSTVCVFVGPPEAPLGVVTAASRQPGRFSPADARHLATLAYPVGVAAAYCEGERRTEQHSALLESMNRVLGRLGAGGTADHLAAAFLAECRALFGCERAAVHMVEADGVTFSRLAVDSEVDLGGGAPINADTPRPVATPARTPTLIEDLRLTGKDGPEYDTLAAANLLSGLEVPLTVRERQLGSVSLWGTGVNRFNQRDIETLLTLTRPFALALERANALRSLAESELNYRSLVAQAEEMIFLFDGATLQILDANQYTERALGYTRDELLSLTVDQITNADVDDVRTHVLTTIQQGELHIADREYVRKDGSLLDVDIVASPVTYGGRQAVLALVRDVSERKSLQAQLIQGQKMESLGLMAGSLAHDFNNLLTTILGFAGLLKRSSNMDLDERENLGLIEDAARRAADLTGRLLAFSRGGLVRFGPVDLRTVIEDTLHLAGPSLHSGLEVTTTLPSGGVKVEGDASQIQQALLNIILNAKDAMPEGGRIAVTLKTSGASATVTIADNGPGMSEETRRRIFEPFYTTKPIGSGTGLGMAITYGIIRGHHGDILVESAPGAGTTFTIALPLLTAAGTPGPGSSFNPGDGNLILVVDDDDMVRRTTSATLAELGYNVVEAPGGAMAVQVVKARPDRFSAVLLDLVMPGMTGSETFHALTAVRPGLPVIVCTGYAADAHIDTDVQRRIAGFVQKPFTAERLARALAEAGVLPSRR
ncbi:MAG: hypothetical protein C0506_13165 [Anaerolinea sp.]|nr:hypothetical protein [Anaerolinea sp.]